jgi:formylglycine-generating enzyme required for sulfatase activity
LAAAPYVDGCPFLGLRSFHRQDATFFFGRRQETLEALAGLGDQGERNPATLRDGVRGTYYRWLQIEGDSGAGKSSLVRAGLVPMIERGMLWARTGFEHWRILRPMTPSHDPVYRLAEAVESLRPGERDTQERWNRLKEDPMALKFALSDIRESSTAFLLIVDQFEELFTFSEKASRAQFARLLESALQDPECPLFIISTIRVDFLTGVGALQPLSAIYNSRCRRYLLPAISDAGLREVIEEPAKMAGLDVSQVSAAIRQDARDEAGSLPLVENALLALWSDPDRHHGPLRGEFYLEHGLAGMFASQADTLLDRVEKEFPGKGRQAALELLLRLTKVVDQGRFARRRIPLAEALEVAGDDDPNMGPRIVDLLCGGRPHDAPEDANRHSFRLITTHSERGLNRRETASLAAPGSEIFVELIHETLVRARDKGPEGKPEPYWPTLFEFVDAARTRDIYLPQLELQVERWKNSNWLGRWRGLASRQDMRRYSALRVRGAAHQFLLASRWAWWIQTAVIAVLAAYVAESYLWTVSNDLPLQSMITLQRFRLGYAPVPDLIVVPPGEFMMGEPHKESLGSKVLPEEKVKAFGALKPVKIARGFKIGKTEVTYDQYDYYVWSERKSGKANLRFPTTAAGGRGLHPVVNLNWYEASAYAAWLSSPGLACRLPTNAEWEYAARSAGKEESSYPWGETVGNNNANCHDCGSKWDFRSAAPVGSFPANALGLRDVSGNVWEWTCSSTENDVTCAKPNDGSYRTPRGGSWQHGADFARLAARSEVSPGNSEVSIGLRVLCE